LGRLEVLYGGNEDGGGWVGKVEADGEVCLKRMEVEPRRVKLGREFTYEFPFLLGGTGVMARLYW